MLHRSFKRRPSDNGTIGTGFSGKKLTADGSLDMMALKALLGYNDQQLLDMSEEELCTKKQILQCLNPKELFLIGISTWYFK